MVAWSVWESTLRARVPERLARVPKKSGLGAASDLRGDVCWAIGRSGSRFLMQGADNFDGCPFPMMHRIRVGGALMRGIVPVLASLTFVWF